MRTMHLVFPVVLFGLLVSTAVAAPPNPFEGSWQGTYATPSGDQEGTIEITIESNGKIRGTAEDSNLGSVSLGGKAHPSGTVVMTFKSDTGSGSLHGLGFIDSSGYLVLLVRNPANDRVFRAVLAPR